MISYKELLNADVADLPLRTRTSAFFAGTQRIVEFVDEVMSPLLRGLLQPNDKEAAVVDTYYRMSLMMRSLLALNNIKHFQTTASIVRSLFELWLDIKILAADTKGDQIKQFHAFNEIERYRAAEQLLLFDDKNPGVIKQDLSFHRKYLADTARTQRVDAARIRTKNRLRYPDHWARKGNVRDRASTLGLESDYVQIYPLLSWYVHSGSTGTAGMSTEAFESCFALCHSHARRMFLDATVTCATVTKIKDATVDHFRGWMEDLRLTPGMIITEEQIKQLEAKKSSPKT